MKLSAAIIFGFVGGAFVGFFWSHEAKKSIADNISTDFSNGKFTVTVDAQQTAIEGFKQLF